MNGPHDVGGADGFGPVVREGSGEPWHLRIHAIAVAGMLSAGYGTPEFRHAIERIPPVRYLASSYYERWMTATASLLVERGVVTSEELGDAFPLAGPVRAPRLPEPGSDVTEPRFTVGDGVRVRNTHPFGHTRCPRYVRGRRGTIVRYDGPCNFDDVEAHSDGKRLEPLYCVRFEASELWGDASEGGTVNVDLFESYLEAT